MKYIYRKTWQSDLAKWEGNVERLVGGATRASYLAGRSNESSMAPECKRGLDNGALLSGRGIPSEKLLSGNSRGTRVRTLESSVDDLLIANCELLLEINFFFLRLEGGFPSFCFLRPNERVTIVWITSKFLANGPLTTEHWHDPIHFPSFSSRVHILVTRNKLFQRKKSPPLRKYKKF